MPNMKIEKSECNDNKVIFFDVNENMFIESPEANQSLLFQLPF